MPFIKNKIIGVSKAYTPAPTNVGYVSSGDFVSMYVNTNGRAWGWGLNTFGQIGDNTLTNRFTPVSVLGAVKTFCKIAAGGNNSNGYSVAIDKNGRAWAWGNNGNGQLGDNTTVSKRTPVSVLGTVKTFCQIEAGNTAPMFTVAIDKNGRAWGWGANALGQLGDNSITSKLTPVSVLGAVKTFCQIEAGGSFTAAIDKNGRAWGWGSNSDGQLGDNSSALASKSTPVSVLGAVKTFCKIAAGGSHTIAIDKNGRAWGWGTNFFGNLGNNATTARFTPVSVLGAVKTFCKIAAGVNHTVAIDKNGRAWAWGNNLSGQLGDNTSVSKRTPVSVLGTVKTFCEISAGTANTIAIDKNGGTWAWGAYSNGQLGDDAQSSRLTPVSVKGAIKTFCQIGIIGGVNTVAIDKNGKVWAWGSNTVGQLGDNTTADKCTPVSVSGAVKTFCKIATGGTGVGTNGFTLAIDKNGRAWGWGANGNGQLGDNSITSKSTPVSVLGAVKTFCKIATGITHTVAIDKNGRAWAWGHNINGQLGDNTTASKRTPVSVLGTVKTFCQIAGGGAHTVAIDKNGRAWAWGLGSNGQIGDNLGTGSRLTPVSVLGTVKTFCQILAGFVHTVAIDKNGRAWSWGQNLAGQLGDNTTVSKRTPISVLGAVKTFCKIAAAGSHTVAIDKNGKAWAWGLNSSGQLGDNSLTNRSTPVSVAGTVKTFCEIGTYSSHTVAIDKNGRAWAWGNNLSGQLGDNVGIKATPVRVCNI